MIPQHAKSAAAPPDEGGYKEYTDRHMGNFFDCVAQSQRAGVPLRAGLPHRHRLPDGPCVLPAGDHRPVGSRHGGDSLIMDQRLSIPLLIVLVITCSAHYRRQLRRSGRSVTPGDVVYVMALTWALAWCWLGLPALVDWGRHMPWSEIIPAALFLFGLAMAPLVLVLTSTWLPRLFVSANHANKKPAAPHLLD